ISGALPSATSLQSSRARPVVDDPDRPREGRSGGPSRSEDDSGLGETPVGESPDAPLPRLRAFPLRVASSRPLRTTSRLAVALLTETNRRPSGRTSIWSGSSIVRRTEAQRP